MHNVIFHRRKFQTKVKSLPSSVERMGVICFRKGNGNYAP